MKPAAAPNMLRRETAPEFGPSTRSEYSPHRALTFLDKLYRDGAIDSGMWRAGLQLREMIIAQWPRSEGVVNLDGGSRASGPAKADRHGQRLTGFRIHDDGGVSFDKRKRHNNRSNERHLEDAIFAACGLHDQEGDKRWNPQLGEILIRVCVHSEQMPTLKGITLEITSYYGAKSKQAPPFAMGVIHTLLGRLSQHYGFSK